MSTASTSSLVRPGLATSVKRDIPEIKLKLRQRVTQLNFKDVRRARLPYYEAVCEELVENNCPNAATLLKKLIDFDLNRFRFVREESTIKSLHKSNPVVDNLACHLKLAEHFQKESNYAQEYLTIYDLATQFTDGVKDFFWIADQLFHILLTRLKAQCLQDEGKLEATVRYKYGKFLREKFDANNDALNHLSMAYKLSTGQETWTVGEVNFSSLFKEICVEYFKVLLNLSEGYRKTNVESALECALKAIQLADESDNKPGISDCQLNCGECYFDKKMYMEALEHFKKCLHFSKFEFSPVRMCWANYRIAAALKEMEDYHGAIKNLNTMKRAAMRYDLKELNGDALLALAINNLKLGESDNAGALLAEAIKVFNEIKKVNKLNQTRCLMAMAKAQPLFGPYVETILKLDKSKLGNNKYLLQILEWKSNLTPFWTVENNEACVSTTDTEYKLGDFEELESSGSSDSLEDFEEDNDALGVSITTQQPHSASQSNEG